MYAVVSAGGKQYKVFEGDVFRTGKIEAPVGDTVELAPVAMIVKDDGIVVEPTALTGAKVLCHVVAQGRGKKLRVFKRKKRKNYARTIGHRQDFTELKVAQIVG